MQRIATMSPHVIKEVYPKFELISERKLRQVYSKLHGNLILCFVSFLPSSPSPIGTKVAEKHAYEAAERHRMAELNLYFESHRVLLPNSFLEAGGGVIMFSDQGQGMDFGNNFPAKFGGVQVYRDGVFISERRASAVVKAGKRTTSDESSG